MKQIYGQSNIKQHMARKVDDQIVVKVNEKELHTLKSSCYKFSDITFFVVHTNETSKVAIRRKKTPRIGTISILTQYDIYFIRT